jgi:inositol phosphorylceramide mannosyltransferase catalytic subunit
MGIIPKRIHLTCRDSNVRQEYDLYFKSIKEHHPLWDIKIYDDGEARQMVVDHLPELIPVYDGYGLNIQRTDMFRLAVVYLYGGFYMDMDMLCYKSLDELCHHKLVLGEEKTMTLEECASLGIEHPLRIANYMFGGMPGHPFWLDVLNEAVKRSPKAIIHEADVLDTTGPGLLTDVYHRESRRRQDITLLPNTTNRCIKWCDRISCHFGEFAAHLHLGKWRWEA